MPPPATYTPRRRLVMNLVLWVLFAATVAGAVLLVKLKTGRLQTPLEPLAAYGSLELRLPKGWQTASRQRDGNTQIVANEPNGQRALSIRSADAASSEDALDFLMHGRALALAMEGRNLARYDEDLSVPGGKGMIIHLLDAEENPVMSMAIVSFHNGEAATVELRTRQPWTAADDMLIYQVAQSLRPHQGVPAPAHDPSPAPGPEQDPAHQPAHQPAHESAPRSSDTGPIEI